MNGETRDERDGISRRKLIQGAAGVAGAGALGGLLAACGGSSSSSSSSASSEAAGASSSVAEATSAAASAATSAASEATSAASEATSAASSAAGPAITASGTISFGSNYSDDVPKKAIAGVMDSFQTLTGATVKINTVDHNSFQEQINNYLQGAPDDVFTWFAGYRMQFFAQKGLVGDISDVWANLGDSYSDAFKLASTGLDGKQYFIPFYNYPWAVFYRKSVFDANGWTPPTSWDEFKTLLAAVKAKGMDPIAFADKDGWPAMGTFDYINMRTNGYDFHMSLMAGKESWEDAKVKQVFKNWAEVLPFHQSGSLGRTWQEAAQSVVAKKSAMYLLGMFVGQQFTGADAADLDFFAFPSIDAAHAQDAVEAPIDGFLMSKSPKNADGAKALLTYLSTPEAQLAYLGADPNNVAANKNADTSKYTDLQKKAVELIGGAKQISQFLDRDTRPDFASTVMIPALQQFIKNPNDIDGLVKSIEAQKKTIFV
jgi:multiple sugar transport system substrate-binding protein